MPELEWTVNSLAPGIEDFLNPVLDAAALDLGYDIYEVEGSAEGIGPDLAVDFRGGDSELLLRRRAALLLSLEQLTLEALRVPHRDRFRLLFDVGDFRIVRIDELCRMARLAARQVRATGSRFAFQPMTSRERRIIHLVVGRERGVTSLSEGEPPRRRTVVSAQPPARK